MAHEKIKFLGQFSDICAFLNSDNPQEFSAHRDIIYQNVELTSGDVIENCILLDVACLYGRVDCIQALYLRGEELVAKLKNGNYQAILLAALNGHIDTIKYLFQFLTEDEKKAAVLEEDYLAVNCAASNSLVDTLEYLFAFLTEDEKKQHAMGYLRYSAFIRAACCGHLDIIKYLFGFLTEDEKFKAVSDNGYDAVVSAAGSGQLDTMKYLFGFLTYHEKKQAVMVRDYDALIRAVHIGDCDIVSYLFGFLTKDEQKQALFFNHYNLLGSVATYGGVDTMKYLLSFLTEDETIEALSAFNYSVLRNATFERNIKMFHYILDIHPSVLNYAELNDREYSAFVRPYIEDKLLFLKEEQYVYTKENPHLVFDVSVERAIGIFFILRNLIRRNDLIFHDDILFLLDIPAVKSIVSEPITGCISNGLLRLALSINNQDAINLLLNIPSVRQLAEANNYYSDENNIGIVLGELAINRESSMVALTTGEQLRLQAAFKHYQPTIDRYGVQQVLRYLVLNLVYRYLSNPAELTKDDTTNIKLPLNFADFTALNLSPQEISRALTAYYQHSEHTALRYLSKPNYWIHANAEYVNIENDAAGNIVKYSTFEEYKPLIAMLYCAAIDTDITGVDGFTPETRLAHFIDELAYIGRAHNWDGQRLNEHTHLMEEYDDLEGDKPSCFSGVKNRLFHSVLGHPLLLVLTESHIKQELREFARAHFMSKITDKNRGQISEIYLKKIGGYDLEVVDLELLHSIDVSAEEQNLFVQSLVKKYGSQFTDEPKWMLYIQKSFAFERTDDAHLFTLMGIGNLDNLLIAPEPSTPRLSSNRSSFFMESSDILIEELEFSLCPNV